MISIKNEYNDRLEEANKLLEHIESISGVVETSILKSSYTLLLYNNLEATVSSVISHVHDIASECNYSELSEELRHLYANYYHFDIKKSSVKSNIDLTISGDSTFPVFSEYCKKVTVFSGNIDFRSLNKILTSYGIAKIVIWSQNSDNILTIKNKRNKLAHGEESFKDCCRDHTVSELKELGKSLERLLNKLIENVEKYVSEENYKIS